MLSFKIKKEIFHRKVEPARVLTDNSDSLVSKEDIQSPSPSLQDSVKVSGFTGSWYDFFNSLPVFLRFCVFSSRKTVEQNRGSAVKTLMVQWHYATMWVSYHHAAFAAELNELSLSGSGVLPAQLALVSTLPTLGQGCRGPQFHGSDSFVASETNV